MTGMIENIHVSLFLCKKEVARIHLPHGLLLVDSLIARSTQSKSNNEWWNKSANMQRMEMATTLFPSPVSVRRGIKTK